ncbi:hypothetical protein [Oceanobacillus sojae]|uniref:Uncharacterized protein n=1 Tax=Oceanobacillus sojae TaxID=582851 RepID=A0A511ZIF0_9BACI|nr:hypothetical protein [Oceanobacillus sojae]GEN87226.1 hypothetical protein OSO01_19650 [Oceanobacillus sojae]
MDERLKKNIEDYVKLNKFLNGRTNRFGENVVDIVMDYVEELEEKNKFLADNHFQQKELTQSRVEKLVKENQHYKEALEFYADEKNYVRPYDNENFFDYLPSEMDFDKGERARKELKGES